jgi:2-C-methyl-D-erythritol 4-phosphate cytidylyltransferase/2-C-methyl-D-erythritol 2,4-cyclodiphosphate synthase
LSGTTALIAAAGRGTRLGQRVNKIFAPLGGQPLLARTLAAFQDCGAIHRIVIVAAAGEEEQVGEVARAYGVGKLAGVATGGAARQESVRRGLESLAPAPEIVAIHDAVRPLVTPELIAATIETARRMGACLAGAPVTDTVKVAGDGRLVSETMERSRLYAAQTPQTFRYGLILEAHRRALADGHEATDDAALVERMGREVEIVESSASNLKVTEPADLVVAEALLGRTARAARVGHGYDAHALQPGRRLMLGGVEVPFDRGLAGHSDADVVFHALCDAALGALALGDIGQHFPDTDPAYEGVAGAILAEQVAEMVHGRGYRIASVDATVLAQAPRLAPHVARMRENVAAAFGVEAGEVSVKATTTEGMGFVGRGEGIACHAVAVLMPDMRVG